MSARVAVTGGSGFIGTNILQFYIDKGVDVLNLDVAAPKNAEQSKYWARVDIMDLAALKSAVKNFMPTHLIHLAARTDLNETRDIEKYEVNTKGLENTIEAINAYGRLERTIFTSSMIVCRLGYRPKDHDDCSPDTVYGRSKASGEEIIKKYKHISSEWSIIRPTSIWGPWFGEPYRRFFELVTAGRYFHIGTESCTKTFGYVKNTVYQIDRLLFAADAPVNRGVFYLGDYSPLDISEWADRIALAAGKRRCRSFPLAVFKISALAGDALKIAGIDGFPMNSFRLKNMTSDNIIRLDDMRKIAPHLPCSVDQGIMETLRWLKGIR